MSIPEAPFPKHALLGHAPYFAKDTRGFIAKCIDSGMDIARIRIPGKQIYALLHPDHVRHVVRDNHRNYRKSFVYKGLAVFLGEGLLTAEGEKWKQNRRTLQPAFHRAALEALRADMQACTQAWIDELRARGVKRFSMQQEMLTLSRDILLRTLFGAETAHLPSMDRLDQILLTLRQYANDRMKKPLQPPLWVPTGYNRRFKAAMRDLRDMVLGILAVRRKQPPGSDLLAMLMTHIAADENPWTEDMIYDEIVTLFVAGQETTTNALTFLFWLLEKHPEEKARLLQAEDAELRRDLLIKEALRLYPPAWAVSREALAADTIGGHAIPEGATLFCSIYAMHRHPGFWNEPDAFQPERFAGDYPKSAYMPFGLGPRMCIGNHFALMEMDTILQMTMAQLRWRLEDQPEPQLITPMTLSPKNDIWFSLEA